jgi:hypothetical protein
MSCVGGKKSSIPPNQRQVGSSGSLSGGSAFLPWIDLGVRAGLYFAMRNSVKTQSMSVGKPPPLDDRAMVRLGLGHYQGGCAPCHGAPGYDGRPITGKMLSLSPLASGNHPRLDG